MPIPKDPVTEPERERPQDDDLENEPDRRSEECCAPLTGSASLAERTVDECLDWAETGDMNAGPRTEQSIKVLAMEVRRLREALRGSPNNQAESSLPPRKSPERKPQ